MDWTSQRPTGVLLLSQLGPRLRGDVTVSVSDIVADRATSKADGANS